MLYQAQLPAASWSEQALRRLRALGDQPVLLVLVLLACNALARPYAGIVHDARLYSFQVLNHAENGAFDDDLYFRHGSQDRYSVFSLLATPLVRLFGLKAGLFVMYLAGNVLFIVGLVCFVGKLIDDPLLRLLSLVYLVTAPLNYGGHGVLHVHESFVTPRLPAAGLVLLGLAQLIDCRARQYFVSLIFLMLAASLHPLMAAGGLLVWAGVVIVDKLGFRAAAALAVGLALAVAVFLALPSAARRLLGHMDDDWREAIFNADAFIFTSVWDLRDWVNLAIGGVSVSAGLFLFRSPCLPDESAAQARDSLTSHEPAAQARDPLLALRARDLLSLSRWRLTAIVGLVGAAGLAGNVLAEHADYALLLLGQPYRSLWLVRVLQVPLLVLLADRLLRTGRPATQLLAFVPLGMLLASGPANLWLLEGMLPLCFLPCVMLTVRGLETVPRRPDWLLRCVAWSLLLGELVWSAYREMILVSGWHVLREFLSATETIQILLTGIGTLGWMLIVTGSLLRLSRGPLSRWLPFLAATVFLAVQTLFFVLPWVDGFDSQDISDMRFVREFLDEHTTRKPTVYSAYGHVDYVWVELAANSYFDTWQTSGFMFHRPTSIEGQRRALVVGVFEIDRFRRMGDSVNDRLKRNLTRFFQLDMDSPPPTAADVARLCAEDLDYIVLRHDFPGLWSASNGRAFIYDCRKLR